MAKPTKLIYRGKSGPRKGDSFPGVPARDLDEKDIGRLDDATIKNIMGEVNNGLGPLYVESAKEAGPEAKPEPAEAKKSG